MTHIIEPERRIPIIADVDVAVAGGGGAGVGAAVAAARLGASVMLVDRLGALGGCMGPGGWNAGAFSLKNLDFERFREQPYFAFQAPREQIEADAMDVIRRCGIAGEWMSRVFDMDDDFGCRRNLADVSNRIADVCGRMVDEAGVRLMLDTTAADVVLEDGKTVCGLIVENASGRAAIRAKVVIDATANASVAQRAGAPLVASNWEPSMNITFGIGGTDDERFKQFIDGRKEPPADNKWIDEVMIPEAGYIWWRLGAHISRMRPYADLFKKAQEETGYRAVGRVGDVGIIAAVFPGPDGKTSQDSMFWGRADIDGKIDTLDGDHMTTVERDARRYMMDTTRFLRQYVPGFENAYLLYLSPYIGTRGGRAIEAERIVNEDDLHAARRFDDVIARGQDGRYRKDAPTDVPYRQLLPRRVENLLAAGVSAHRKPPNLRERTLVIHMGQAAGTAAALAAASGVTVREVDLRRLQRILFEEGVDLGGKDHVQALLAKPAAPLSEHAKREV
ncbi:MAG: hypothetical protein CMJ18_13995 [Phycisphaeraceae bacterium]|nr:hypothetical protein [Phycisphaeraceae bacterium]